MNDQVQLQSTMWLMIVLQTVNAVDLPGHGTGMIGPDGKTQLTRKLPAPKTYIAVVVLWSIFGLIADAGQSRVASIMSWAAVATSLVVGPAGSVLTGLLKTIAQNFGTAPPASPSAGGQVA